ncbi:MAG: hypothetical protein RLZZ196_2960 [Bacteroidota bacterium]|jgi:hypothetical protein
MNLTPYFSKVEEFNKFERIPGATAAVYTCDVLTCIATLKCGSSFLTATFNQNARWRKIPFSEINWDSSHVFSLMSDPLTRRYKAIAEWLFQNQLAIEFYKNVELQNFVLSTPILDIHSYGYIYNYYEEFCNQIDWIPMESVKNHDGVKWAIVKLLEKYKITISQYWANDQESNISFERKKKLEADIKEKFQALPNEKIMEYLLPDIDLYNRVSQQFNPNGDNWDDISWLRK